MARNGAGTYNLPIGNPVTTGTTISSTWANSTLTDIATALTGSISSDGQTAISANLPMGGYAHTGVAVATVRTMYASAGQVQDGTISYLTSVSGTNAITAVAAIGMTAYAEGQTFTFVADGDNTGAATLNINSIGAKAITKNGATALSAGDIVSGAAIQVVYDGTQFQLVSSSLTVRSFSAGTTGLTPSTGTTGDVTLAGTLNVANGGTGSTSLTANNVLLGNGTSAVQAVAPSTSGNILTSNGTTWESQPLAALGVNQTWQNVLSSRAVSTTYTNSTGKTIAINVVMDNVNAGNTLNLTIGGVTISGAYAQISNGVSTLSSIIPSGASYSVTSPGGGNLIQWVELR